MSAKVALVEIFNAGKTSKLKDPGSGGTISVNRSPANIQLVSAGAEARTLSVPTRPGAILLVGAKTVAGDITLTVTSGFNTAGDTVFTFTTSGQWAMFVSVETAADTYRWRLVSHYGLGNVNPTESASLDGLLATVAELNQAADESANVETVVATRVLTAADSGKTIILAAAVEFDTKLPAPAVGLRFRFIVGLAPAAASYTITTNGVTQNVIHGIVSSAEDAAGAGAQTNGTAVDVVTFVDSKAQVGDWVELICDGTLWYLRGACVQQDAITLA